MRYTREELETAARAIGMVVQSLRNREGKPINHHYVIWRGGFRLTSGESKVCMAAIEHYATLPDDDVNAED